MVKSETVPEHDVGIFNGAVLLDDFRQTLRAVGVADIFAGGITLVRVERRYPDVVADEVRTLSRRSVLTNEGRHAIVGMQLVCDRLSHRVELVRVDHFPGAMGVRIGAASGNLAGRVFLGYRRAPAAHPVEV